MMDITEKMELQGNCMLVPIYNPSKSSKDDFTEEEALMLDKMHKERIKLSDAILVVNVNDYIGSSTKSEIEFAKSLNKEIIYYTDLIKQFNCNEFRSGCMRKNSKKYKVWKKYQDEKNLKIRTYRKNKN